ncbi:HEAT repeat domain-containing protein [Phytoactinopolyspora limicola]|uniref:HEAT repeat domain-containing protein n=1 Tax=Phytoactinopolyspora limicola TaxID=2715536 RepID=UPI00140CCB38|nr:HEAT repeat domain-containing protein [Phytoactinopolyspora limicola]
MNPPDTKLFGALSADDPSTRLAAALAVGTQARPGSVEVLVARCATEPDFFVREMLTWALTRYPAEVTVPRLVRELRSEGAQARSQALHTLSKIGDTSAWPAITRSLLHDADDEVARAAWRAAVVLVPTEEKSVLTAELAAQLGRGNRDVWLSLTRALVALGDVILPALTAATASDDSTVVVHARATELMLRDPDAGFDDAVEEAKRCLAPGLERARGQCADR